MNGRQGKKGTQGRQEEKEEHEKQEEAREREEAFAETYELREKLAVRNEVYSNLQERRRMRKQAREDRYQAWWDRVMH